MKLIESELVTNILGVAGIVLYPYIFVKNIQNKRVLNHEYIHIMQIRRSIRKYGMFGVIFWYTSYLWEWVKKGYRDNKYEREAFDNENHQFYILLADPDLWKEIDL